MIEYTDKPHDLYLRAKREKKISAAIPAFTKPMASALGPCRRHAFLLTKYADN